MKAGVTLKTSPVFRKLTVNRTDRGTDDATAPTENANPADEGGDRAGQEQILQAERLRRA